MGVAIAAAAGPAHAAMTFNDGGVHNVTTPADDTVAAAASFHYNVSGGTTVNLLDGAHGLISVANNDFTGSVINLHGGIVGVGLGTGSQGTSNLRGDATLNIYGGTFNRRFFEVRQNATVNFHADVDIPSNGLQRFELRDSTVTVTFHMPEGTDADDVVITSHSHAISGSGMRTEFTVALVLPGGTEARTIRFAVWPGHDAYLLEEESSNPSPTPTYGLDMAYFNFDGTVKTGHINFVAVPEPASVALLTLGSLALLRRSRQGA